MQDKDSVVALLHQIQESLGELSTTVGELANQVEQTRSHNFLTESEMAAHLCITTRAIQKRRYCGSLPYGVWQKVGGKVVYSLKHYEEWLESIWLRHLLITTTEPPKPLRRKKSQPKGRIIYKLT